MQSNYLNSLAMKETFHYYVIFMDIVNKKIDLCMDDKKKNNQKFQGYFRI